MIFLNDPPSMDFFSVGGWGLPSLSSSKLEGKENVFFQLLLSDLSIFLLFNSILHCPKRPYWLRKSPTQQQITWLSVPVCPGNSHPPGEHPSNHLFFSQWVCSSAIHHFFSMYQWHSESLCGNLTMSSNLTIVTCDWLDFLPEDYKLLEKRANFWLYFISSAFNTDIATQIMRNACGLSE